MTNLADALEFSDQLAARLQSELCDVRAVRDVVMRLEWLAPAYPETRFCKGCVLPIVDELINSFLSGKYGADRFDVYRALRCEGFDNLGDYYPIAAGKTGFSSYARGNTYRPDCKQGTSRRSRPSPDFCIRYHGATPFTLVGETKFSLRRMSDSKLRANLLNDLRYYLGIKSEPNSDWGHDFGVGIGYCAAGDGPRAVSYVRDHWQRERIVLIVFSEPS